MTAGDNKLAQLMERHPLLFRGEVPTVMSYVSAGWFDLIDRLCSDLEQILGDRAGEFEVEQVKEKFGGLRFYWSMRGAKPTIEVDIGGVSAAALGESPSAADGYVERVSDTPLGLRISIRPDDELSAAIAARILRAEEQSFEICQVCGAPGELRRGGWLHTACDAHARRREAGGGDD